MNPETPVTVTASPNAITAVKSREEIRHLLKVDTQHRREKMIRICWGQAAVNRKAVARSRRKTARKSKQKNRK